MAKPGGIERAAVIPRIKSAIKAGKSASAFIRDMRAAGLGYRRTDMLADFRSAGNIEKKTGLLRFVRKDRMPSPALYADVSWKLSKEYLYKLKVQTRLRPGEPETERWVNIISDKPLTPGEWERELVLRWGGWYPERKEELGSIEPILAVHKVAK